MQVICCRQWRPAGLLVNDTPLLVDPERVIVVAICNASFAKVACRMQATVLQELELTRVRRERLRVVHMQPLDISCSGVMLLFDGPA